MTIGQRIAQKRKELGLSQEALGEQLNVSRQSIYKWESDAALPEIDKLIALSRLFGVSVGWLLGVEEDTPPAAETVEAESSEAEDELSEAQLKMVEEIVGRYLDAQPKPAPRKKWPWLLLGLAVLLVSFHLINRLDQIDQQYQRVQMTVSHVQDSVNNQINGISSRVEEILKSQNNLTAEYDTEVSATVLEKNQIRFSVYAIPKTYIEGMEVKFSADNHTGGINKSTGEEGMNHKFTATLASDLTDKITLSVTFIYPDGTHETQILDTYEGLYSKSLPWVDVVMDHLSGDALTEPGLFTIPAPNKTPVEYVMLRRDGAENADLIDHFRIGLFHNQNLVAWAEQCDMPEHFHGFDEYDCYVVPDMTLRMAPGDTLCWAAVVTDIYGREVICSGVPVMLSEDGLSLEWTQGHVLTAISNNGWTYD